VFYAPQYVALNLGFFAAQGLEIELTNGAGADKVMTAVLSGQSDIGFAGPEATIYVYNQGRADYPRVFAQLTKRDGSFLMGRKPEPDFDWRGLKGKFIICGRKGGVPEMTLEYVLKKKGLVPGRDVDVDTSVQFALMAGAFLGGMGDYVTIFEPTASMLEKEGKAYIVASIGRESGEIPYTAYFAEQSYLKKNAAAVQKFTNAIYQGQLWVARHTPEEVAMVIKPSFPDTDEDILVMVAKRYKEQDTWCTDPILRQTSFDLLQNVMALAGELPVKAPYGKIVDTSFAKKAVAAIKGAALVCASERGMPRSLAPLR
jgi:NitT/TauT family transport system substrate-binding protein